MNLGWTKHLLVLLISTSAFCHAKIQSEEQWLVSRVIEDIRRISDLSRLPGVNWEEAKTPTVVRKEDALVVKSGEIEAELKSPWSPNSYLPFLDGITARGTSAPSGIPKRLLDFRVALLTKEAGRISAMLRANLLDPQAHEEAALLHGVMVLREAAGRFYDVRFSLCRMTAHLALSKKLRGVRALSLSGQLAEVILDHKAGRNRIAMHKLNALKLKGGWHDVLHLSISNDWTQEGDLNQSLFRILYTRALLSCSKGQGSNTLVESIWSEERISSMTDWQHVFLEDAPTRKFVIGSVSKMLQREAQEIDTVWNSLHKRGLMADRVTHALNAKPGYCINPGPTGEPVIHVLDWGTWAAFTQRHLCHIFTYVFGRQLIERRFSGLDLYPFVLLQHRRGPLGVDRDTLHRAVRICRKDPGMVNAVNWYHLETLLTEAGENLMGAFNPTRSTPYPADRWRKFPLLGYAPEATDILYDFPRARNWFLRTVPSQTAYRAHIRQRMVTEVPMFVDRMFERDPYNPDLCLNVINRLPPDASLKACERVAGGMAQYNIYVINAMMARFESDRKAYLQLMARSGKIAPSAKLAEALYLQKLGLIQEAEQAFSQAVEKKVSPKLLAAYSQWVVDYYLDQKQPKKAELLLAQAAKLGFYESALRLVNFFEDTGNLKKAEKSCIALQRTHVQECPLLSFYIRQSRLHNRHNGAAVVPKILKEIQLNPRLSPSAREAALKRSEEIVYPGLMPRINVKRQGPPLGGLEIVSCLPHMAARGVNPGAMLVGLNGMELQDIYQYYFLRDKILAEDARFLLWQDGKYLSFNFGLFAWDEAVKMRNVGPRPETVAARIASARAAQKQVVALDLSNMGLTDIPEEVFTLHGLRQLDLSFNPISLKKLHRLRSLHGLRLNHCSLRQLPDTVSELKQLRSLELGFNLLTSLPAGIAELGELTRLDAKANLLSSVPDQIGRLKKLTFLRLTDNRLTALPDSVAGMPELSILSLGRNRFSVVPEPVFSLAKLRRLLMFENQIFAIDPDIGKLQLTRLDLRWNLLMSLPKELGQMKTLKKLQLGGNSLSVLPPAILQLTSLSDLDLGANFLSSLPPQLGMLPLRTLCLSTNRFSTIPAPVLALKSLHVLDYGGVVMSPSEEKRLLMLMKGTKLRNTSYEK